MKKTLHKESYLYFVNITLKILYKKILFITYIFIFSMNACDGGNNLDLLFKDSVFTPTVSISVDVTPFPGNLTATANYNYYDASAHLTHGPGSDIYVSKIYFYEGTDGLYLFFHHNIHGQGGENCVNWTIIVKGNELQDSVILSDDSGELTLASTDTKNKINTYQGNWWYSDRTDGGIIGPFVGSGFSIKVELGEVGNITDSLLYSATGETFDLKNELLIVY